MARYPTTRTQTRIFLPVHFHELVAWSSSPGSRTDVLWRQSLWLWVRTVGEGAGGGGRKSGERMKGTAQVERGGERFFV